MDAAEKQKVEDIRAMPTHKDECPARRVMRKEDGGMWEPPLPYARLAELRQQASNASLDDWGPMADPPTPSEVLALLKAVGL
jgi:hypothetical protein